MLPFPYGCHRERSMSTWYHTGFFVVRAPQNDRAGGERCKYRKEDVYADNHR